MNSIQINRRRGSMAVALLLISFAVSTTLIAYLKVCTHTARLNVRAVGFQRARILAESALDAGEARLRDAIANQEFNLASSDLQTHLDSAAAAIVPTFEGSAADYEVSFLKLRPLSDHFVVTMDGGKLVEYLDIRIVAGVNHRSSDIKAAMTKQVRITREPFLRYAIFFDDMLELHPGPAMVINGDIRSNSQIELWALNRLDISGKIYCPGQLTLFKSDESDSYSTNERRLEAAPKITVYVEGSRKSFYQDGGVLDSLNPLWEQQSAQVWKGRVAASTEVAKLAPPIKDDDGYHSLIEPKMESDNSSLKAEKLAYKADPYIHVNSDGTKATVSWDGRDTEVSLTDGQDWVAIHDGTYYDPREKSKMRMVDLDLVKLMAAFKGTSIVYVEVDSPSDKELKPAVRLNRGADLSAAGAAGLTVASHRTTYVKGDYNTGGGDKGKKVPALLAADNLTLLSNKWKDSEHASDKASETTLNAALMIGYADPEKATTGGAHNLLRFQEDWTGVDYNFCGSYISLWTAEDSACVYGNYYSPPNRNITYDSDFLTTEPPGMPIGYSEPETVRWEEIGWDLAAELATED